MKWISFRKWSGRYGKYLKRERIYNDKGYTIFINITRRYKK